MVWFTPPSWDEQFGIDRYRKLEPLEKGYIIGDLSMVGVRVSTRNPALLIFVKARTVYVRMRYRYFHTAELIIAAKILRKLE